MNGNQDSLNFGAKLFKIRLSHAASRLLGLVTFPGSSAFGA